MGSSISRVCQIILKLLGSNCHSDFVHIMAPLWIFCFFIPTLCLTNLEALGVWIASSFLLVLVSSFFLWSWLVIILLWFLLPFFYLSFYWLFSDFALLERLALQTALKPPTMPYDKWRSFELGIRALIFFSLFLFLCSTEPFASVIEPIALCFLFSGLKTIKQNKQVQRYWDGDLNKR